MLLSFIVDPICWCPIPIIDAGPEKQKDEISPRLMQWGRHVYTDVCNDPT